MGNVIRDFFGFVVDHRVLLAFWKSGHSTPVVWLSRVTGLKELPWHSFSSGYGDVKGSKPFVIRSNSGRLAGPID